MSKSSNYRVTRFERGGKRRVSMMSEKQLQRFRATRLKSIRKDELGLTQKAFADAVGVNLRTLQDWEIGRSPMPKSVEILMALMKDMPAVKKKLVNNGLQDLLAA